MRERLAELSVADLDDYNFWSARPREPLFQVVLSQTGFY
jgi:hypothetical protein